MSFCNGMLPSKCECLKPLFKKASMRKAIRMVRCWELSALITLMKMRVSFLFIPEVGAVRFDFLFADSEGRADERIRKCSLHFSLIL